MSREKYTANNQAVTTGHHLLLSSSYISSPNHGGGDDKMVVPGPCLRWHSVAPLPTSGNEGFGDSLRRVSFRCLAGWFPQI